MLGVRSISSIEIERYFEQVIFRNFLFVLVIFILFSKSASSMNRNIFCQPVTFNTL